MSSQWEKTEPSAWQRAVAARARGERPDPEDVAEARRLAQPDTTPGWARLVAERAVGQGGRAPASEEPRKLSEYEKRLRRRLGMPDNAA